MEVTADQGIVGILVVTLVAGFKEGGMPKWMTGMAVVGLGALGGLLFVDFNTRGAAEGIATAFVTAGAYGVITSLDKAGKPTDALQTANDDAALAAALRRILSSGALLDNAVPLGGITVDEAARNVRNSMDARPIDTQPAHVQRTPVATMRGAVQR